MLGQFMNCPYGEISISFPRSRVGMHKQFPSLPKEGLGVVGFCLCPAPLQLRHEGDWVQIRTWADTSVCPLANLLPPLSP